MLGGLGFVSGQSFSSNWYGRSRLRDIVSAQRAKQLVLHPRRRAIVPILCSDAPSVVGATTTDRVTVYPSTEDVRVGDILRVEYDAPAGVFGDVVSPESKSLLFWAGGFSDWSGKEGDETLLFPMLRLEGGRFRVSVCVPEFANSVVFGFVDESGYSWDTNDGKYYRIPVRFQKRFNSKEGKVEEIDIADGVAMDLSFESASPPVLDAEVETTLHKSRGEATFVGEQKGLGNVLVSQARDTFDRFDVDRQGHIPTSKIAAALDAMGFELTQSRIDELVATFVSGDVATMTEFMLIYADLELSNEGIEIV